MWILKKIKQVASYLQTTTILSELNCRSNWKSRKEGVITVEEAKGTETTVEVVEGMQFDRGYLISILCYNH